MSMPREIRSIRPAAALCHLVRLPCTPLSAVMWQEALSRFNGDHAKRLICRKWQRPLPGQLLAQDHLAAGILTMQKEHTLGRVNSDSLLEARRRSSSRGILGVVAICPPPLTERETRAPALRAPLLHSDFHVTVKLAPSVASDDGREVTLELLVPFFVVMDFCTASP